MFDSLWNQLQRVKKEEEERKRAPKRPPKQAPKVEEAPKPPVKKEKPIVLKVLTAGEGGVGKTTLIHKYVEGHFLEDTKMTIGVEFHTKYLMVDGRSIALQIWDFGGQEQFRFMLEAYAKGAKGAILMFDLTRYFTLKSLDEWSKICRSWDPDLPILFAGSKFDLGEKISVDDENAEYHKDQLKCFQFIKVSSKTGLNVEKAFEILTRKILERLNP